MEYYRKILLRDGRECCLRNGTEEDAKAVLDTFRLTHSETDYLLTYPDEITYTEEQEREYLKKKTESANEIEIVAAVDGRIVGMAGIESVGTCEKIRHRADLGISIEKEYWSLGIGRAMMEACIECARNAGYKQVELTAVGENERALALYRREGFVEYGRNPKGFRSRLTGWQETVHMRLELDETGKQVQES